MTERISIERNDNTGGLLVQMTTALGSEGHLIIELALPHTPALGQMPILELQADLMEKALAHLTQKLAAARRADQQQSKLP